MSWAPIILFGVMFLWTPPHYWPLSMKVRDDYARVGVPMLPVVASNRSSPPDRIYSWAWSASRSSSPPRLRRLVVTRRSRSWPAASLLGGARLQTPKAEGDRRKLKESGCSTGPITYVSLLFVAVAWTRSSGRGPARQDTHPARRRSIYPSVASWHGNRSRLTRRPSARWPPRPADRHFSKAHGGAEGQVAYIGERPVPHRPRRKDGGWATSWHDLRDRQQPWRSPASVHETSTASSRPSEDGPRNGPAWQHQVGGRVTARRPQRGARTARPATRRTVSRKTHPYPSPWRPLTRVCTTTLTPGFTR